MNLIQNIVFDLGGVIINIDYDRVQQSFERLSGKKIDLYRQQEQHHLFDALEKGQISLQVFRENLRDLLDIHCSDEEIDLAWNSILVDIPQERIDLIKKLKTHCRLFLLSNTNAIHKKAFDKMVQEQTNIENFR